MNEPVESVAPPKPLPAIALDPDPLSYSADTAAYHLVSSSRVIITQAIKKFSPKLALPWRPPDYSSC